VAYYLLKLRQAHIPTHKIPSVPISNAVKIFQVSCEIPLKALTKDVRTEGMGDTNREVVKK
jgi:hypothetical protein